MKRLMLGTIIATGLFSMPSHADQLDLFNLDSPVPVCRVADDTLTVTWRPVPGARDYLRGLADGEPKLVTDVSASQETTWRVSGSVLREKSTARQAHVSARNRHGSSADGICTFETPPEPPASPTPTPPPTATPPAHSHPPAPHDHPEVCRWEHRFLSVPTITKRGRQRGILRISARKKGARVRIEAFDRVTGKGLDIRDLAPGLDRLESGSSVTLGAANTVERFALDNKRGNHTVIVSHAEHVDGMRAVTAELVRRLGGTVQVFTPDVIEHCEPAGEYRVNADG